MDLPDGKRGTESGHQALLCHRKVINDPNLIARADGDQEFADTVLMHISDALSSQESVLVIDL